MRVAALALAIVLIVAGARWWMRECARAARFDVRWPHGSGRAALRVWIQQNMPDLDRELGPLSMDQVRMRLNEITGLMVLPVDPIEHSCAEFLAALQAQHARKEMLP